MKTVRRWSVLFALISAVCFVLMYGLIGSVDLGYEINGWAIKAVLLLVAGCFFVVAAYTRYCIEVHKINKEKKRKAKQLQFYREYAEALSYKSEVN